MFEYLKRTSPGPADSPVTESAAAQARVAQAAALQELGTDEAAAAEFVLHCDFSELRLAAAELIHAQDLLERVHGAIRNTDRRVAKLLQGRLDVLRHHQAETKKAQTCIAQGQSLLADPKLTPNMVADLDHHWAVIAAPHLSEAYSAVRTLLGARLEAQVSLQRSLIDQLASLKKLESLDRAALDSQQAAYAAALAGQEGGALPKGLRQDFAAELARRESQLKAAEQVVPAPPADAPEAVSADAPAEANAAAAAPAAPVRERKAKEPRQPAPGASQAFLDTLDALESALQQGSLHSAADLDKALKDMKGMRLSAAQNERLANIRAELKRLADWARWGGNVSREELVKAADGLATQKMPMAELAKKVGSLRERWKALDAMSGHAPKSLWERFDAACTTAYAPAAAHFKRLADERHGNADKAQALILEAKAAGESAQGESIDWRGLAAASTRLRQAWSHLGAIDRKEKKRLDNEFAQALKALNAPLEAQRQGGMSQREELITEAEKLDPVGRHALDQIRKLQERWQEQARALPLERKAEQALWQRFRAACDAIFAKRKESAHAADAERKDHQKIKEALCQRLEESLSEPNPAKLLREVADQWRAAGPVPRANEAKLDKRYQSAVAAINKQQDAVKRNAGLALASAMREKLRLCQALESAIAGQDGEAQDWSVKWSALPPLGGDYDKALQARFDAALAALNGNRAAYAAVLEKNRAALLQEVLRMEITAGVDSGADFARERLKLQVEVLQSSLKSGQKPLSQSAQFSKLCAMPALTDTRTASRIEHLFRRLGKDHK